MAAGKYILARQAVTDLKELADGLDARSLSAADRVINELLRTFQSLAANPGLGTQRDDLHEGLRIFTPAKPARKYVVFYYPIPDGIMVSDVIHSARDWVGMFASDKR